MSDLYRPLGYTGSVICKKGYYTIFFDAISFSAIGYRGKSKKSTFHYKWKSLEQMERIIKKWISDVEKQEQRKEEERKQRIEANKNFDARNFLKEGDIICNSWGYEQTNIDFYKVVEITRCTIKIIEIGQYIYKDLTSMSADVMPEPDKIKINGEKWTLKVKAHGSSFSICSPSRSSSFYFKLWDGRPQYKSWYY